MGQTFLAILISVLAVTAAILAVVFLAVPLFKGLAWILTNIGRGIAWFFTHIFTFIFGVLSNMVRAIGGVLTSIVFVPLIIGNVLIGRWSAASHFGRGFQDEVAGIGRSLYRAFIGHPAKFLLLGGLVEGIEQRIPHAVAQAPGADRPSGRTGQFDGYTIVGSLPGGGSGGRLYVADPDDRKRAAFSRAGREVKQVVIKTFSLSDGSSLPQIIRESRALEAAKKLGLILDHELTDARFFYVMEYIPGDSLTTVTKRLHTESGAQGLGLPQLNSALSMMADLLGELDRYHRGGLWHKDVKPDNIIINSGRAHLVDLGLVTPLRSAMTLTTHGTEYFRDPELVRMALRGAKVNEVDGVKFDLYGAGAVLYSIIENSFPAHGGLSQITRACPEAVRWVVRRAMADLGNRYAAAGEMLADLRSILASSDAFMLKPADLPSVKGGAYVPPVEPAEEFIAAHAGSPTPAPAPQKQGFVFEAEFGWGKPKPPAPGRARPRLSITDWWTGGYRSRGEGTPPAQPPMDAIAAAAAAVERAVHHAFSPSMPGAAPRAAGRSAADQLHAAQERVRRAQDRVRGRLSRGAYATAFAGSGRFSTKPNSGVAGAFFIFLVLVVALPMFFIITTVNKKNSRSGSASPPFALAGNIVTVETATGRVSVNLDSVMSKDEWKQSLKDSIHAWRKTAADAKNSPHPASDSGVSELNQFGERVSTFFDNLRAEQASHAPSGSTSLSHPTPPPPVPAGSSGSVLILNHLPADMLEDEQPALDRFTERLTAAGFAVRGRGDTPEDQELLAAGLRAAELASPDDAETAGRLEHWLNQPGTGLDAVLWVGPGQEEGQVVRRLIVRDGFDPAAVAGALATGRTG
jgi:serine/threonine protein kinase